jgi:hypothetical protein
VSEPIERGWMALKSQNTKRYHYIIGTRAICGGFGFYTSELVPDNGSADRGPEDCAACFKRLRRQKVSNGVSE